MAAAQLRLLRIFGGKLVADAVQQLHIALLRVLLKGGDEGPGHGAGGLAVNLRVLSVLLCMAWLEARQDRKTLHRVGAGAGLTKSEHLCFQTT